jgi:hypothetical protein
MIDCLAVSIYTTSIAAGAFKKSNLVCLEPSFSFENLDVESFLAGYTNSCSLRLFINMHVEIIISH